MTPRILAFAGSLRRESFNKKLVPIAAKGARDAGAEVTLIGLEDFPLPVFDQDLEARQGMPENGKKLKQLFIDHDGLLIASPGVQQLHHGGAEERHRLGVAAGSGRAIVGGLPE